jgi:16S rRNA C967 or C1407 C5-methylase (RsmB/RsmF family)/NOL1/NOP2/fmu family ribosome biogenesis protein
MNLPSDFITRTRSLLGNDCENLFQSLLDETPVSIRFNNKLNAENANVNPVPWCHTGRYLQARPLFTADPHFHAGAYYVQEASSMFLEQAISQYVEGNVVALDLCAAPGGKSTHLLSLLSENSLLVSNEIVRSRAHILMENIAKWGNANSVVSCNTPRDFGKNLPAFFDLMVVDAPCSGEGMFRKDPDSIKEWSVSAVKNCAARQREILTDVWDSLKTGGILTYSTCTYNREENEEIVQWICEELGAEFLPIDIKAEWEVTASDLGYHFYPHKTKGEGFFMAVLKKTSENDRFYKIKPAKTSNKTLPDGTTFWTDKLKKQENWKFIMQENLLKALPKLWANEIEFLQKQLYILSSGISLAEQKGRDFIPQPALALSKFLDVSQCIFVEADWQNAIAFLRKESIVLPDDLPRDYVLLRHENLPLGWLKNLGNRSNNLYPNEWRIRMNVVTNDFIRIDKIV